MWYRVVVMQWACFAVEYTCTSEVFGNRENNACAHDTITGAAYVCSCLDVPHRQNQVDTSGIGMVRAPGPLVLPAGACIGHHFATVVLIKDAPSMSSWHQDKVHARVLVMG